MNDTMKGYLAWTMKQNVQAYKAFLWEKYGYWIQRVQLSKQERKDKSPDEIRELRLSKWTLSRLTSR